MNQVATIACQWAEPASVLAAFAESPFAVGLLSDGSGGQARWSYLARDPIATLTLTPNDAADPLMAMRAVLGPKAPSQPDGPPFQGGLIGLSAYELGARIEPLTLGRMTGWPDLVCGLYPALLAFDHAERRVLAIGRGETSTEAMARAEAAALWLKLKPPGEAQTALSGALKVEAAATYETAVAEVVERIAAGEIFQANIARAWRGRLRPGARPFDLTRRLARESPAPFAAYLRLPGRAVASNSPERFLQVRPSDGGFVVQTRPIKGTRPRGRDAAEDAALAAELLASAKDRAENLMIVDLMRNDLARVCEGVETRELFRCESFANVHHLVSTVEGRLRRGLTGLDAFMAAFPPGSVTGAPKIQAMKVIAGLEPPRGPYCGQRPSPGLDRRGPPPARLTGLDAFMAAFPPGSVTGAPKIQAMKVIAGLEPPRGPYCGSLFWAGFDGALDASVLIRTAVFDEDDDGWSIEARAGAGIVADSNPASEAAETEAKIAALERALAQEAVTA